MLRAMAKSYRLDLDEVETMRIAVEHCWEICSLTEVATKSFFCSRFSELLMVYLSEIRRREARRTQLQDDSVRSSLDEALNRNRASWSSTDSLDEAGMRGRPRTSTSSLDTVDSLDVLRE